MNNFKKGGFKQRSGGPGGRPKFGSKFGGGRDRNDRSGGRMELFPATCSDCKKNCQVPFRPSGDKPVYCRDCFNKQPQVPGRNSNGRDPRPFGYKPEQVETQNEGEIEALRQQLVEIEYKVNRILELVSENKENPTPEAPTQEEAANTVKIPARKTKAKK